MLKNIPFWLFFSLVTASIHAAVIEEKVLICGICKNIESTCVNVMESATELGEQFSDYQVIFYENNSDDMTKSLLKTWEKINPHVLILSEDISKEDLANVFEMQVYNRIEAIARARNKVLDLAMQEKYKDYTYVIWADLDLPEPWDTEHVIETILHPEQEWDAVFANGAYDLFALRDAQFPVGFELLGNYYWGDAHVIRRHLSLDPAKGWRKVYSAFGGLGIYKRDSLKGCRYGAIITKELEETVISWLTAPSTTKDTPLLARYIGVLYSSPLKRLDEPIFYERERFSHDIGVQLNNGYGSGKITWFSCIPGATLPFTCEHILLHVAMAAKGHDKLFINPKLISNHP